VSAVCCQVEVSATGLSLVQGGPNGFGVVECDREASIMRRPWPTGGCCAMGKNNKLSVCSNFLYLLSLSSSLNLLVCEKAIHYSKRGTASALASHKF
jgi:hypothetical protein